MTATPQKADLILQKEVIFCSIWNEEANGQGAFLQILTTGWNTTCYDEVKKDMIGSHDNNNTWLEKAYGKADL